MRRTICVLAVPLLVGSIAGGPLAGDPDRRMSFHNRLLLNRAVLAGLASIEVMVVATAGGTSDAPVFRSEELANTVARLGGTVKRIDEPTGFLRVEVPTERLLDFVRSPSVAAYQIASLSKAAWYRDGPPVLNAEMYRGYEVTPIAVAEPETSDPKLPALTPAESRASGYTLEDDAGVGRWMNEHPTFDGRGVTIAWVEDASPDFTNPVFRTAKTLDGRDVTKIVGILNTISPADRDVTRVVLDREVSAETTWVRIGQRTFVFPRLGRYRFGMLRLSGGANVVHEFGVAEHQDTHEVWLDSDGDASFANETPLIDVNERFDPRILKVTHPSRIDLGFVMGRSDLPNTLHIYLGRSGHQSMTMSVAAGDITDDSLAYGVAPRARVLLVRTVDRDYKATAVFDGFLEAARRADVDVIGASAGIKIITDTEADFAGIFFDRLISVYRKPIINAAGNNHQELATSDALGNTWTIGGVLGPATFAALHGGRPIDGLMVHPIGAAGPSLDGAIKPDFLAPMERLAVGLPWKQDLAAVPRNAPTRRIPHGYEISCCTSSTSPYATGFVALLISAAKQTNTPYSVETLDRALKFSSTFLPGFQVHEQGHGALDIAAAWQALKNPLDVPPHIVASANIVHPLAQYAARGGEGKGIFEFNGWTVGMTGTREIRLRRESGSSGPIAYEVKLSGNDGTFETLRTITLPLGRTVRLPVHIRPAVAGTHSILVSLVDRKSNATVFRTQATVVAAERFDPSTGSLHITGQVGLMRVRSHHFYVPPGTSAISIDLDVHKGVVLPTVLRGHGLFPSYYLHVHPMSVRFVGKGRHTVVFPHPEPGNWALQLQNTSAGGRFGPPDVVPTDDSEAEYAITVRAHNASIEARSTSDGRLEVGMQNTASTIREPILEGIPATLRTHRGSFHPTGLPNVIEMTVPEGAGTLSVKLRSEQPGTNAVELFLYDCTTGECFSYDLGFPAGISQTKMVRNPKPGRWVAAVNTAPFPAAPGSFVLEVIITSGEGVRRALGGARAHGARWTEWIAPAADVFAAQRDPQKVMYFELLDGALARDEAENVWIPGPNPQVLRDRPVAVGTAIYRR